MARAVADRSEAWTCKRRGDNWAYVSEIVATIERAAEGLDVIVLAQGSMASAAALCTHLDVPVLSSPELAVKAVLELAKLQ